MRRVCSSVFRPVGRLSFVVAVALVGVLAVTPAASAAPKRVASLFGSAGSGDGQFSTTTGVGGLAINQSGAGGVGAGDVYVVDRGGQRIERFSAAGSFLGAFGLNVGGVGVNVCTTGCVAGTSGTVGGAFATPQSVAVDQVDGSVYVLDGGNRRVQKFTATGGFLWAAGKDVDSVSVGTATEVCVTAANCQIGSATTPTAGGEFAATFTGQVAVDPTSRNLYVTDPGSRRVQQLTAAGAFVRAFGFDVDAINPSVGFEICTVASECKAAVTATAANAVDGRFTTNQPTRLAVDSSGVVYTVEQNLLFRVQRFTPFGVGLVPGLFAPALLNASFATTTPTDVAIDPATQNVVVARAFGANATIPCPSGAASVAERRILVLDGSGTLLDSHMDCAGINAVNGLAVRSSAAGGEVYVSSTTDGQRVFRLNEAGATSPVVTVAAATSVATHTATLNGSVGPDSAQLSVGWHFEYSKDGVNWNFAPAANATVAAGAAPTLVTQAISGLEANRTYRVRLAATKQYNSAALTSNEVTFTTEPLPLESVATLPAAPIRSTNARFNGTLNPNNQPATYHFEYGTTTDYGSQTPAATAGGGTTATVSQWATGLEPGTLYHYRIVASTETDSAIGADQTFVTRAAVPTDDRGVPVSPTGRAYEMVTPPEKPFRSVRTGSRGFDEDVPPIGVPAAGGDSVLISTQAAIVGDAGSGQATDLNRLVRDPEAGWTTQPLVNLPAASGFAANGQIVGANASQDQVGIRLAYPAFPGQEFTTGSWLYTRFLSNPPAWAPTPGWDAWNSTKEQALLDGGNAYPLLVSDDGRYQVMSAVKGVGGDGDPSLGQTHGPAVYRQDLTDGGRELVNECTGGGATATLVPERVGTGLASDTISAQACGAGTLVSPRGAAVGAGVEPAASVFATGTERVLSGKFERALSEDGSSAVFMSPNPNLGAGASGAVTTCATTTGSATLCPPQVYVRRWDSQGVPRVAWISRSRQADGQMIPGQQIGQLGRGVGYEDAAADGSKVFFRTNAPLTPDDPNGGNSITTGNASPNSWDLYEYDLPADHDADPGTGTLTRISAGPNGNADPNTSCHQVGTGAQVGTCNVGGTANAPAGAGGVIRHLSDDGTRVYFVTASPIGVGGDPWNASPHGSKATNVPGGAPVNSTTRNLYLYDSAKSGADRWKFIAQLPFSTSGLAGCAAAYFGTQKPMTQGFNTILPSNCVFGAQQGDEPADVIAFMTTAQLTPDDDDSAFDVYAYDSAEDELTRVSASQGGAGGSTYACATTGAGPCNGDLGHGSSGVSPIAGGLAGLRHQLVSTDGAVYFQSRRQLVAGDTNGSRMDVYEWKDGDLSLISPGDSDDDSMLGGTSADGRSVFFGTSEPIDAREIDPGDQDIYVARIGGGFPPPAIPPTPCPPVDDACQKAGSAPTSTTIGTARRDGRTDGDNAEPGTRGRLSVERLDSAAVVRLSSGRRVSLRVKANVAGSIRVVGTAKVGKRPRRVISASRRVTQAGTVGVPIRLSTAARGQLAKSRQLTVVLRVAFSKARAPVTLTIRAVRPKAKTKHTTRKGR